MRAAILILPLALLIAASEPVRAPDSDRNPALAQARADLARAVRTATALRQQADAAEGEAATLAARQVAAAQDIDVAEARISAAAIEARDAAARADADRRRLAIQQRPIADLIGGLALMGQRPPLLALADGSGTEELVRVKLLLDATLPAIRRRTAALRGAIAAADRNALAARMARQRLTQSRIALVEQRRRFAALEQQALARSQSIGGEALGAEDSVMASGEELADSQSAQASTAGIRAIGALFANGPAAPPRPFASQGSIPRAALVYRLPADAPVTQGLGAVDESGVRSRGLTLATARGAVVSAPATGVVRFVGPYGGYDGVIIIDHGGGWMSVIVNAVASVAKGDRVSIGEPLGRALGPLMVELSRNGQRLSPALIAGSSAPLSNGREGG